MIMILSVISELFFFFLIVFLFLELEQPIVGSDPYFLRMFNPY